MPWANCAGEEREIKTMKLEGNKNETQINEFNVNIELTNNAQWDYRGKCIISDFLKHCSHFEQCPRRGNCPVIVTVIR